MKQRLKYIVEYLLAGLFIGFLRSLPFSISLKVGALSGGLFYWIDRRHRRVALDNLAAALGKEKSAADLKRIALGSFKNVGRAVAEFVRIPVTSDSDLQKWVEIEGFEHYLSARQKGKGVIYLTAHFGNWELMAAALSFKGFPIHVVARPIDNPYLDRMVNRWRERNGNRVLNKRIAAAEIIRLLRKGETIGFLLDQNTARSEAVFVDYFGRPAATHKGLAIVALRTGAPVVPVFFIREGGRRRIVIEKELNIVRTGALDADIFENTALFTRTIESVVRRRPDHWLWVHRRWKTRPEERGR